MHAVHSAIANLKNIIFFSVTFNSPWKSFYIVSETPNNTLDTFVTLWDLIKAKVILEQIYGAIL